MALEIENGELPPELIEEILGGKCIAFIGSGVSAGCYAEWFELVNQLCGACGIARRVTADTHPNEYLEAAQEAKDADTEAYGQCLRAEFGKDVPRVPRLYHLLLSLPFRCYLTVNIDPLLALLADLSPSETRIAKSQRRYYPALDRMAMAGRSIHYVHGCIGEGDAIGPVKVVLTKREFEEAYENNGNAASLLVPTLINDSIVFVGCGLREPTMQRVFGICRTQQQERERLELESGGTPPRRPPRYILRPIPVKEQEVDGRMIAGVDSNGRAADESTYSSMGLATVWYDAQRDHLELRTAFDRILGREPVKPSYSYEDPTDGR